VNLRKGGWGLKKGGLSWEALSLVEGKNELNSDECKTLGTPRASCLFVCFSQSPAVFPTGQAGQASVKPGPACRNSLGSSLARACRPG